MAGEPGRPEPPALRAQRGRRLEHRTSNIEHPTSNEEKTALEGIRQSSGSNAIEARSFTRTLRMTVFGDVRVSRNGGYQDTV